MQGLNMGDVAPVQNVMSDPPAAQQQQQRRKRVSFPPGAHVEAVRLFDKQKPATEYQQQHQYASIDPATCSSILLGHLQLVFAGGKPLWPLMPSADRLLKQLRKQGLDGLIIRPKLGPFRGYAREAEVGLQGHGLDMGSSSKMHEHILCFGCQQSFAAAPFR
jgi:hypothetical protein